MRLHDHRRGAGELDLFGNRRPERRVRDDLVALLEQRHRRVVERLLGAGGDDHFLGLEARRRSRADSAAQIASRSSMMPADGVYLVKFASSAACAAVLDVLGRREIRLAGAEIDDVDALRGAGDRLPR